MTGKDRFGALVERTVAAVTKSPGHTSPRLRRALVEQSRDDVPEELLHYVATVTQHAYRVSDGDVDAVKRDGYDDDEIFELTAATALGAALARLRKGMAALEESR
jgi:alkylhydroperoxidase family enzyme